ncbi:VanZ like protein [Larkinella arboricola]|uniref:VanZ like protein n=1 Tax=Larkinella arboricola TaxID=643671 RepID=A0A327WP67_LARAB|nr:VanZ family protein [Larkinella arboricola]RAJ94148.1 VanZ like protein [Larkinella arboricola]
MRLIYFFTFLGIALIFYLSWVPDPHMSFVWFLPEWVAHWADVKKNADLRTAVPFVFLGFMVGTWLSRSGHPWSWWVLAVLGLTLVAVVAEAGQLVLPQRHFSWADILWGAAGSGLGLLMAFLLLYINRQLKVRY